MKSKNLSEKILRSVKSKGFKYIELESVVEANHIVQRSGENFRKFMFSFIDHNGNELCLRPDLTIASCLRYLENNLKGKEKISNMIKVASLTRKGFIAGDISTLMSPRTVLHWAENIEIFKDTGYAFRVTFLNRCDEIEKNIIAEYYQRCFGEDLPESMINIQI